MTKRITGIKSVDFRVTAEGFGVINWNGPVALSGENADLDEDVKNHSLPKLRGYTNLKGGVNEKGIPLKKSPEDIDFKETPMYASANCIRHHLFKEHSFDAHYFKESNQELVLASAVGLLRGFVTTSSGAYRTSPLFLTDFVDRLGNGNFEQMGRSGSKLDKDKSTTHFSKTTFGDTFYEAFGSINIEELSFISLDSKFGRAAAVKLREAQIPPLVEAISSFIESLAPSRTFTEDLAVFDPNYVRLGTIFDQGEAGILLSQEAIDVLVDHMIDRFLNLSIKQAKGYMNVIDVEKDYNDSNRMLRIKHAPMSVESSKGKKKYATYFEAR